MRHKFPRTLIPGNHDIILGQRFPPAPRPYLRHHSGTNRSITRQIFGTSGSGKSRLLVPQFSHTWPKVTACGSWSEHHDLSYDTIRNAGCQGLQPAYASLRPADLHDWGDPRYIVPFKNVLSHEGGGASTGFGRCVGSYDPVWPSCAGRDVSHALSLRGDRDSDL